MFHSDVVAPDFKVHRTANLRVVNVSVISFIFSVAPRATVYVIAEKVIHARVAT
jgi:choline dehydrogenase-like flavoprotein